MGKREKKLRQKERGFYREKEGLNGGIEDEREGCERSLEREANWRTSHMEWQILLAMVMPIETLNR